MKSLLSTIAILLCLSVSFGSVFANPDLTDKTADALQANNLKIERANIFWRYLINTRKSTRFDGYLPLTGGDLTHAGPAQTFINFRNTGGDFYIGKESSTAGAFFTGSSAYANVLYSWGSPIQNIINGVNRFEINNSGVNVNGILTGTSATFNGALTGTSASFNQSSGIGMIIRSDWDASATNNSQLYLTGSSNTNQQLRLGYATHANYGYIQALVSGTDLQNLVLNPSGGNVGIGTTAPAARVEMVVGDNNGTSGTHGLRIVSHASGLPYQLNLGTSPTEEYNYISSGQAGIGLKNLVILGNNVGIGTTRPHSKLHIQANANTSGNPNNAQFFITGETSSEKRLSLAYNTSSNYAELQSQAYSGVYTPISFNPNGGDVAIGTTDPKGYKLAVAGKIRATEIKVEVLPWSDFVFEATYKLPTLQATEQFIKANKHLAEIPSAAEVAKDGINLGEMNAKLLQKIEELTLHMIDFNKKMEVILSENQILKVKVAQLEGNR